METLQAINAAEGVGQRESSHTDAGNGNWEQPLGGPRAASLAMTEKEIRMLPNTTHKNKLQLDSRSK